MDDADFAPCDRCGKAITDFTQVGYLGPADRSDTRCSPFVPFETVCIDCEQETPP